MDCNVKRQVSFHTVLRISQNYCAEHHGKQDIQVDIFYNMIILSFPLFSIFTLFAPLHL